MQKQSDSTNSPAKGIIETQKDLNLLVEQLSRENILAFDLEADSLHHYTEKVCLIQVSNLSQTALIDPLAPVDLSPLAPVLADRGIRKVFHGADYDMRSLYRDFGLEVCNMFDTMIACQFLGEKEVGLAAALKKRFGVELNKKYQKADWSKRPFSAEMIEYAKMDTALLIRLYLQLEEELRAKGRLEWVEEESELVSCVRAASRDHEPLFIRFKGAAKLKPRALAVLEELLRMRDEKARKKDVPPFRILGNEPLRELAELQPRTLADLNGIPGLTQKLIETFGREILKVVAKGAAIPVARLPHFPSTARMIRDRDQEARLKRLKEWREAKAVELGLGVGIIANNSLLEALADTAPSSPEALAEIPFIKCWQRKEFAAELLDIIQ
ncbi:ribonuclease D, putative [Geotalea daltonii FRC-32]|uniref:Ribonuclease D, putative n=1 Tax=Geotalea daltonii (strain DSM 22248 / JCM 15807 / FRC-32) TaxID=316067 RepID=B9LZ52_GEODF|nr:HRDC domain-containing protein [Geotalea daltonii]ACM18784.2 ribonuclease D, putative [Geotalea daltonii FRC-32]